MRHIDELDACTAKFSEGPFNPLRITVNLHKNSRIVSYDPIHLDGLLARAVVEIATQGRLLADCEDGYWIPLPLKMLWRDRRGFPMWAASVLYPTGIAVQDTYVRHKRNSGGEMHNKQKLITKTGSWMERRIPTPVQVCDQYEARCIGHLETVQDLLDYFTHIGKLRLGRVKNVQVEIVDFSEADICIKDDRLIKPVPMASDLVNMIQEAPFLVGWTPPHWKPSLFMPGWKAGMKFQNADPDFFGSAP